jgi:hypothetical protein
MIASFSATLPLDLSLVALTSHLLAPSKVTATPTSKSTVSRLYKWRAENREIFEARRIAGMKRSARVRENLQRIHAECKAEWRASALKNPKLQATDRHIAAKEWTLKSPDGRIHTVRNLKKFIRDNPALFDDADIVWKHPEGKPNQAWCRAFHALGRLRPTCFNKLSEWQGWTWAGESATKVAQYSSQGPSHFSATSSVMPLRAA